MNRLIILLSTISNINGIWPPSYKVDLKHEEEFIISELLDRSDVMDIYDEEEIIHKEDLKHVQLHESVNSDKYFRLHGLAKRENLEIRRNKDSFSKKSDTNPRQIFPEFNPDLDESKPWVGGFVDEKNNIVKNEDTIYFDDAAKSNKTNSEKLEKRNADNNTAGSDYSFENLKAEYDDALKKAESKNDTLKYKDVKEEETPAEAAKSLANFTPRNCTEEEKSGMGFSAISCFLIESRKKHFNKNKKFYMLKKVFLIASIWIFVYLLIALPLWCQYGWCCCCCRCKFCHPRDEIEEIKTFCANNPPGVYRDDQGNLKKYGATTYEIYAQKNLEKAIHRL